MQDMPPVSDYDLVQRFGSLGASYSESAFRLLKNECALAALYAGPSLLRGPMCGPPCGSPAYGNRPCGAAPCKAAPCKAAPCKAAPCGRPPPAAQAALRVPEPLGPPAQPPRGVPPAPAACGSWAGSAPCLVQACSDMRPSAPERVPLPGACSSMRPANPQLVPFVEKQPGAVAACTEPLLEAPTGNGRRHNAPRTDCAAETKGGFGLRVPWETRVGSKDSSPNATVSHEIPPAEQETAHGSGLADTGDWLCTVGRTAKDGVVGVSVREEDAFCSLREPEGRLGKAASRRVRCEQASSAPGTEDVDGRRARLASNDTSNAWRAPHDKNCQLKAQEGPSVPRPTRPTAPVSVSEEHGGFLSRVPQTTVRCANQRVGCGVGYAANGGSAFEQDWQDGGTEQAAFSVWFEDERAVSPSGRRAASLSCVNAPVDSVPRAGESRCPEDAVLSGSAVQRAGASARRNRSPLKRARWPTHPAPALRGGEPSAKGKQVALEKATLEAYVDTRSPHAETPRATRPSRGGDQRGPYSGTGQWDRELDNDEAFYLPEETVRLTGWGHVLGDNGVCETDAAAASIFDEEPNCRGKGAHVASDFVSADCVRAPGRGRPQKGPCTHRPLAQRETAYREAGAATNFDYSYAADVDEHFREQSAQVSGSSRGSRSGELGFAQHCTACPDYTRGTRVKKRPDQRAVSLLDCGRDRFCGSSSRSFPSYASGERCGLGPELGCGREPDCDPSRGPGDFGQGFGQDFGCGPHCGYGCGCGQSSDNGECSPKYGPCGPDNCGGAWQVRGGDHSPTKAGSSCRGGFTASSRSVGRIAPTSQPERKPRTPKRAAPGEAGAPVEGENRSRGVYKNGSYGAAQLNANEGPLQALVVPLDGDAVENGSGALKTNYGYGCGHSLSLDNKATDRAACLLPPIEYAGCRLNADVSEWSYPCQTGFFERMGRAVVETVRDLKSASTLRAQGFCLQDVLTCDGRAKTWLELAGLLLAWVALVAAVSAVCRVFRSRTARQRFKCFKQ